MDYPSQTRPLSPALLESDTLLERYQSVRNRTDGLAKPISAEDAQVQSMPDVSPTKWHLAHTTWFFETFLLRPFDEAFAPHDERFHFLFNSYYEAEGPRHARPRRGMITRPGLDAVKVYRKVIDDRLGALLESWQSRDNWPEIAALIELGCHHEEQHQELLLTDIKHVLHQNPYAPGYAAPYPKELSSTVEHGWTDFDQGIYEIGHKGDSFAYDNEGPGHKVFLNSFSLGNRLITNGEFLAFMEDGGYEKAQLWLSEGWDWVNRNGRDCPLYWKYDDNDGWTLFSLYGRQPINLHEPISHINLFEADAYASWAGARLPREEELEVAAATVKNFDSANDLSTKRLHPLAIDPTNDADPIKQLAGDCWEWTMSSYAPYPGFKPANGAVGEYNGKFMCNQYVLRGGSCVTPPGHWRPTYRNFFPASAQWQFSGLRLAKDL